MGHGCAFKVSDVHADHEAQAFTGLIALAPLRLWVIVRAPGRGPVPG